MIDRHGRRRWTRTLLLVLAAAALAAVTLPALASTPVQRYWDTSFSLRIPASAPAGEPWWATIGGSGGSIALQAPAGWVICAWRIESATFGGTDQWTYHYRADGSFVTRFGLTAWDESTPGAQAYNTSFELSPVMAWTVTAAGGREEYYWVDYVEVSQTDCGTDRPKEIWYFRKPDSASWGGTASGPADPMTSLAPGTATQPSQPVDWVKAIYDYLTNPPAPPSPPGLPAWNPYQPPGPVTMVPVPQPPARPEAPIEVPPVATLPVPPAVPPPPPLPPLPPVDTSPFADVVDPVQQPETVSVPEPPAPPDPVLGTDPVTAPDPATPPDAAVDVDPVTPPDPVQAPDPMAPDPVMLPDPVQAPDPVPAAESPLQPEPPPPGQVQDLSASAGPGSCFLTWSPVAGASGYRVYRDFATEPLAMLTATSYEDTGLVAGTQYAYQVAALDSATGREGARSWPVYCSPS